MWGVRCAVLVWPSEAFHFDVFPDGSALTPHGMSVNPSCSGSLRIENQHIRLKSDLGWDGGWNAGFEERVES